MCESVPFGVRVSVRVYLCHFVREFADGVCTYISVKRARITRGCVCVFLCVYLYVVCICTCVSVSFGIRVSVRVCLCLLMCVYLYA